MSPVSAVVGDLQGITETVAQIEADTLVKLRLLLDAVGQRTVAYLRSFTSESRPPIRSGSAPRPAHPGHWADVKGQLAASYESEVAVVPNGLALVLRNGAEYAAALEARDGFFVLSGVTDPGGPVETALRQVIATIAPDWTVRSFD